MAELNLKGRVVLGIINQVRRNCGHNHIGLQDEAIAKEISELIEAIYERKEKSFEDHTKGSEEQAE